MKDFQNFIDDLKILVSFNTEKATAKHDAPFGEENKKALEYFLKRAEEMGFSTINYDNYIGEIIFGEGEQEIGIIGHLDVVPAGTDWQTPPFTLTEKEGALYGRGVADDKGPTLLCLYALKELKDSEANPNCKFRFFVGCNEESGWKDIEYLQTKTTLPTYGFSPDGMFPLSYAEKGVFEVQFLLPEFKKFKDISGGFAVNAVCALATVKVTGDIDYDLIKKYNLSVNDGVITSIGVAAHGSTPHLGKNAFLPLLSFMRDCGEDLSNIIEYLFNDKAGVFKMQNEQGIITLSPNIIRNINGKTYLSADVRVPAPFNIDDLLPLLNSFGIEYNILCSHQPVMVEKEGWFVSALLSAYKEITKDNDAKAMSMCGSTFARAFEKGCSFGPDSKERDFRIHNSDENIRVDEIKKMYEIYKTALFKLSNKAN